MASENDIVIQREHQLFSDPEKVNASPNGSNVSVSSDTKNNAYDRLREMYYEHEFDYNFPSDLLERARDAIDRENADPNAENTRQLVAEFNFQRELSMNDSPYPEVRAVVDPTDDPTLPVNTFRVWLLGSIFCFLGTGVDQFFSLRQPGIWMYSYLAQFLCYPLGVGMAKFLPSYVFPLGPLSFTLNPGPFNEKEHMLITIMSNVAYGGFNGTAYVTYILQVLRLPQYYNDQSLVNQPGWQITLVLATQLLGYGTAGLARRFLVYPQAMIWPKNLAQIALNKALHHDEGREDHVPGWRISRFKFLLYCFGGMFVYYWFPDYIFTALSSFNWMTWISPANVTLAVITGTWCGMGLNPLPTFDWNVASYFVDPIITPFFANANIFAGLTIVSFFIVVPVFFSNVWSTGYIPINSSKTWDNTGNHYNISRILNSEYRLDEEAYAAYSPPYLSASYAVVYMIFFACYLASITHVFLYNRREIMAGFSSVFTMKKGEWYKSSREQFHDVHNRLMMNYKDAPEWWYMALLAFSFILACVSSAVYDTGFPIWGVVLAVAFSLTLQVPLGIIMAVTNNEITLNVVAELIAGYAFAGNPIPNMIFKMYGYIATAQSIQFAADLKLAHYTKIPPRLVFFAQVYATILGALTSIGVNDWQLSNIANICTADAANNFVCPGRSSLPSHPLGSFAAPQCN
jgi:OPT family small oligopeptide transporter